MGPEGTRLAARHLARLGRGASIHLQGSPGARGLLITGKPIGEPIVHYGPFVMNTEAEIRQAINDYNRGVLTATP